MKQYLQEEVMRYEEILRKMQDYDENLSKEKIARAYQEKEKRKLEVSFTPEFYSFAQSRKRRLKGQEC